MTSGMGVRGTMGRCYGHWMDFKQCQQDFSEEIQQPNVDPETLKGCMNEREDYMECLHGTKQFKRYQAVHDEKMRQEKEAKDGGGGGH